MTFPTLARPEGKFELLGADAFEGDEERAGVAQADVATNGLRGQTAPACGRGAPAATTNTTGGIDGATARPCARV